MRVVGIVSPKGGVGKTTISLNLSTSLSRDFRRKVVLVDACFETPHLTIMLGPRFKRDASHFLRRIAEISKVIHHHEFGFKFLPAPLFNQISYSDFPIIIESTRKEGEIIIVDTPPGIKKEILEFLDEIVIVTTPDPVSIIDCARIIRRIEKIGKEIFGIIINRVERKRYEVSKAKIMKILKRRILGEIPEDTSVKEAFSLGKPVVIYKPNSKASIEIRKIAGKIVGVEWKPKVKGFLGRILRLFG